MAIGKISARGFVFEYFDGTTTYTQIGGLKQFMLGYADQMTDTTTFASLGQDEHEVMSRNATLKLEGFYLLDTGLGTQDPGQALVETLAQAVATASVAQFRVTRPDAKRRTFSATATLADQGGGNNDKATWGVLLTRTGATPAWA